MTKVTFKPHGPEFKRTGDVTVTKEWDIYAGGKVIGSIHSVIRDLNQDYTNPGYSVTVTCRLDGLEQPFYQNSNTFSNRSIREAREHRSEYVHRAKEWAKRKHAQLITQVQTP